VGFFTRRDGTNDRIENNALLLEQPHASILLDEFGTVRLMQSLDPEISAYKKLLVPFHGFVEEDVRESIQGMLHFAGAILDEIDPLRRLRAYSFSGESPTAARASAGCAA